MFHNLIKAGADLGFELSEGLKQKGQFHTELRRKKNDIFGYQLILMYLLELSL